MIEHLIYITNLMCRNHNRLSIRHARRDKLAELALSGNIQPIGRLVHQEQRSIRRKRETHEHLLLLSHRQRPEININIHLETMKVLNHILLTKTGIEGTVQLHIADQGYRRQFKFLRNQKHILQSYRQPATHIRVVEHHPATFRHQQPGHQIKKSRLSGSILSQQPIYPARLE